MSRWRAGNPSSSARRCVPRASRDGYPSPCVSAAAPASVRGELERMDFDPHDRHRSRAAQRRAHRAHRRRAGRRDRSAGRIDPCPRGRAPVELEVAAGAGPPPQQATRRRDPPARERRPAADGGRRRAPQDRRRRGPAGRAGRRRRRHADRGGLPRPRPPRLGALWKRLASARSGRAVPGDDRAGRRRPWTVRDPPAMRRTDARRSSPESMAPKQSSVAAHFARELAERLGDRLLVVRPNAAAEPPAHALQAISASEDARMIVIGGDRARFPLGSSLAARLPRLARCPVIVVPEDSTPTLADVPEAEMRRAA